MVPKKACFKKSIISILMFFISSCILPPKNYQHLPIETRYENWKNTLSLLDTFQKTSISNDVTDVPEIPTLNQDTVTGSNLPKLYLHPGLPPSIVSLFDFSKYIVVNNLEESDAKILLDKNTAFNDNSNQSTWVYVLVAPFYTQIDGISSSDLLSLWEENNLLESVPFKYFYLTEDTYNVMNALFGVPDDQAIKIVSFKELNELALTNQPFLTLLPIEALNPIWKVMQIDGKSVTDYDFNLDNYPLTVNVWIDGNFDGHDLVIDKTNYDISKRTVIMMTGVTALTRATAYRMENYGNNYPGKDVYKWFSTADFVHISNEVAFAENCPFPDPIQPDLIFCSSPDRIELLDFIGTNIIELSGNHLMDFGRDAIDLTLQMYDDRNWKTFAGGWDIDEALTPTLIEHNDNQIAFLGCNPVGPPIVWATDTQPGAAPCSDYQWLVDEISSLKIKGYLPIVTLQYFEDYTAYPSPKMETDFLRLADAGAVFVSGSQAHTPKSMVFVNEAFIHYGLGNLFFDQMEVFYNETLMEGTREGFIDRLVFYDGRLMSIELLTTILEDYAKPRPMNPRERDIFLERIFNIALESYE